MADASLAGGTFKAPLMLLADGLDAEIEDFVYRREVAVAAAPVTVAAGVIEPGTVSAQRFSYTAIVGGREALTIEHITRMGADQAPDWPTGRGLACDRGGHAVDAARSRIAVHGEDDTEQGCLARPCTRSTPSSPCVPPSPGIKTFLDLPMITGRGILTGAEAQLLLREAQAGADPGDLVGVHLGAEPAEAEHHDADGIGPAHAEVVAEGVAGDESRGEREQQERRGVAVDRGDPTGGDGTVDEVAEEGGHRRLGAGDELGPTSVNLDRSRASPALTPPRLCSGSRAAATRAPASRSSGSSSPMTASRTSRA